MITVRTQTIKCITPKKRKDMNYLILAETEFFGLINADAEPCNLNTAYDDFIKAIIELCCGSTDTTATVVALAYTENELQHHRTWHSPVENEQISLFVRKALTFVRKIQKHLATNNIPQVPPLTFIPETPKEKKTSVPALRWTGNAIDLVEIIYGIHEMGCINGGEIPLKQLAPILYSFFGVETKDCYRFYTDIKRRKTISHTHFLEQMQARLNERIRHDEEAELNRR